MAHRLIVRLLVRDAVAVAKLLAREDVGQTDSTVAHVDDGAIGAMPWLRHQSGLVGGLIARVLIPVGKLTAVLGRAARLHFRWIG